MSLTIRLNSVKLYIGNSGTNIQNVPFFHQSNFEKFVIIKFSLRFFAYENTKYEPNSMMILMLKHEYISFSMIENSLLS